MSGKLDEQPKAVSILLSPFNHVTVISSFKYTH